MRSTSPAIIGLCVAFAVLTATAMAAEGVQWEALDRDHRALFGQLQERWDDVPLERRERLLKGTQK